MGFFSTTKKIKEDDFKKNIDNISGLSDKEKAYLEGAFQGELINGMTKTELEAKIRELKKDYNDDLSPSEVEKVKDKLMKELK